MSKLDELAQLGQSVWLDYIHRSFISTGELKKRIDMGLRGMTSNPSIFEKAISGSADYAEDLERMVKEGKSTQEIYDALVVYDIRLAADLLRPVYDATQGEDGYVSLEVSPILANDTEKTIIEAQRLWSLVARPNLMVKIPATPEGLPAITRATMAGINVNITLIFSIERYQEVIEAYLNGLEERLRVNLPISGIASVASFFVSRVDTKIDKLLEKIIAEGGERAEQARLLLGKAAVANAKMAYNRFCSIFEGPRFSVLKAKGARYQRPLWASTSTKNPAYSDIKYVQELIGPHTVNTMPEETLDAFIDHGEPRLTLEEDLEGAMSALKSLEELGISMDAVTQELETEGVASFTQSFEKLMTGLEEKTKSIPSKAPEPPLKEAKPGQASELRLEIDPGLEASISHALVESAAQNIIKRIWDLDYTLWKPDPTEITNRMGWLRSHQDMPANLQQIETLVKAVQSDAYTHGLLLGMGGSSLAADLFAHTFSGNLVSPSGLKLLVLDSTNPAAVLEYADYPDPFQTLYIVSTKSGTTEETLSFFKYFYNRVVDKVGQQEAGDHFIAITDPDSSLVDLAEKFKFRAIFRNDPNIGGRYSALSFFGLVPAALSGVDIRRLLARATSVARLCGPDRLPQDNPAARLGTILGEAARSGRDKVTFIISPAIAGFGDWVEQLVAESTGKEGKGLLPVIGEQPGAPAVYGPDRIFIHIRLEGDTTHDAAASILETAGFPLIRIHLNDPYDLGGLFFLWELAVAIASIRLEVNPFDQPDVESAKKAARAMMATYKENGALSQNPPDLESNGVTVFYPPQGLPGSPNSPGEALRIFLEGARPGDYIALQAFLQPTPEVKAALEDLRLRLRGHYKTATTLGFGPRFLHSTGQFHKGGPAGGYFLQFTNDVLGEHAHDASIPNEAGEQASSSSFGALLMAQALGDRQALIDSDRRVLRFHFGADPAAAIRSLGQALE